MKTNTANEVFTVSSKNQVTIPKRLGIKAGQKIKWILYPNGRLEVFVMPTDPIKFLRGSMKGMGSVQDLLDERRKDLSLENKKYARYKLEK